MNAGAGYSILWDGWGTVVVDHLWQACLQGALVIPLVWATCRTFKRIPVSVRCWLWWLSCAKLLLGLVWTPGFPLLPSHSPSLTVNLPSVEPVALIDRIPKFSHQAASGPVPESFASPPAAKPEHPEGADFEPSVSSHRWTLPPPRISLFALWLIGASLCSIRYLYRLLAARRIVRASVPEADPLILLEAARIAAALGLRRPPPIRRSPWAGGPLVSGPFRPIVILPADTGERFSAEEMRMALGHELSHVRRWDLPLALAPVTVEIALFFNPLAWVAIRGWKTAAEASCDEQALRVTGASPVEYGRMLLRLADLNRTDNYAGMLGATTGFLLLKERLKLIETYTGITRARLRWAVAGLVAVSALCAVPWRVEAGNGSVLPSVASSAVPMLPHRPIRFRRILAETGFVDVGRFVAHVKIRVSGRNLPRGMSHSDIDIKYLWPNQADLRIHTAIEDTHEVSDGKQTFIYHSSEPDRYTRIDKPSGLGRLLALAEGHGVTQVAGMTSILSVFAGSQLDQPDLVSATFDQERAVDANGRTSIWNRNINYLPSALLHRGEIYAGSPVWTLAGVNQHPGEPAVHFAYSIGLLDHILYRLVQDRVSGTESIHCAETMTRFESNRFPYSDTFGFVPPPTAHKVIIAHAPGPDAGIVTAPHKQDKQGTINQVGGWVLAPDGRPVSGARVCWISGDEPQSNWKVAEAVTGSDGRFRFNDPGRLAHEGPRNTLVANAVRWGTGFVDFVRNDDDLVVNLNPPTELRIKLIDEAGRPVLRSTLRVDGVDIPKKDTMDPYGSFKPRTMDYPILDTDNDLAVSNDEGVCTFRGLPQGYIARLKVDDVRFAQLTEIPYVILGWSPVTTRKPISLIPGGSIIGRVTYGATGRPAAGIRIGGAQEDYRVPSSLLALDGYPIYGESGRHSTGDGAGGYAVTDANGRYEIDQLPPGQFAVAPDLEHTGLGRAWTAHLVRDVEVPKGGRHDNVNIQLIGGAIIHGRVTYRLGKPIAHALLGLKTDDTPNSVQTDENGEYEMRAPGGNVTVYFPFVVLGNRTLESFTPHTGYVGPSPPPMYKRDLIVSDGQSVEVNFKMPR